MASAILQSTMVFALCAYTINAVPLDKVIRGISPNGVISKGSIESVDEAGTRLMRVSGNGVTSTDNPSGKREEPTEEGDNGIPYVSEESEASDPGHQEEQGEGYRDAGHPGYQEEAGSPSYQDTSSAIETTMKAKATYHNCNILAGKSELSMYQISSNGSSTVVDRHQCIRKSDLDFNPTSSWILLTVADLHYFEHARELLRSLLTVPQKGGLPKKVVVIDIGMSDQQKEDMVTLFQRNSHVNITIENWSSMLRDFNKFDNIPQVPKSLGYYGDGPGGVAYRVKALAVADWFQKLSSEGVDQLVALDAGGVFLSSAHRVRNFAAMEGFYGGFTGSDVPSALVSDAGLAPEAIRQKRLAILKEHKMLPQCFDYNTDFQVDESNADGYTDFSDDGTKILRQYAFHDSKALKTIEGGFLVFDRKHAWVHKLIESYRRIMASDKLWAYSQGYYFPHDQKILGNELWKVAICESTQGKLHLLDTDNIRFGSVAQKYEQRHHDIHTDKFPWSGYAYAYCGKSGDYVRHPCVSPESYPMQGGWEAFADMGR